MSWANMIPGPFWVALIQGLLALADENIRTYFSDQPWLPIVLTLISLFLTLFNVYLKPKLLAGPGAEARGLTAAEPNKWLRVLTN